MEFLYLVWNEREKVVRKLSEDDELEFFNYFSRFIVNNMKRIMLKLVRKFIGLEEEFYFNNKLEFMNV